MHITEHFELIKCACPCCDMLRITPGFFAHMKKLEKMRRELGFPLIITSAYRCPAHNREVGGAVRSWHLLFATDIRPTRMAYAGMTMQQRLKLMYKTALGMKWGGIGYYDNFLHLDMRPGEAIWRE